MNLYQTGVSGLSAAKALTETTAQNIANVANPSYHRQGAKLSTAGGQASASGFVGRGARVDTVNREFDHYKHVQVLSAEGKRAELTARVDQLSHVNAAFANEDMAIGSALTSYFGSVNALASRPDGAGERQNLIGSGESLSLCVRAHYTNLQTQREGVNGDLTKTIVEVNKLLVRINEFNQSIVEMRATSGGHSPNDLLDLRDAAVAELNNLIGVKTSEDGAGRIAITLDSGKAVLTGARVYELRAVRSAADPERIAIAYTAPDGPGSVRAVEMDDSLVSGGLIGGLVQFRSESLDTYQSRLGQLVTGLAMAANAVHEAGFTSSGTAGGQLFSVASFKALGNIANAGSGAINGSFSDAAGLTGSDYSIMYDGAQYTVTRLSDNYPLSFAAGSAIAFDGMSLAFTGTPARGDTWLLTPTRHAAATFEQVIKQSGQLATADKDGGALNGKNAQALANLQTTRIFQNKTLSLADHYAQTVNLVGGQTARAEEQLQAQSAIVTARKMVAPGGVNVKIEEMNLLQYQQFYIASARVIDAATKIFDTLLGLRA
jgi:flagellar hook-associated protein 1 FlgK